MKKNLAFTAVSLATMAAVAGCSTTDYSASSTATSGSVSGAQAELAQRVADAQAREARLTEENASLKSQIASYSSSAGATAPAAPYSGSSSALPPNPLPGECYARVYQAPTYNTVTQKITVQEPGEKLEVIPATYRTVTEKVLVREASEELRVVPATYRTVTEKVLVKPESYRIETVPPTYGTETVRVIDEPARSVWQPGRLTASGNYIPTGAGSNTGGVVGGSYNGVTRIDNGTGEVLCLVEIPATYKTITKRVLKTPGSSKRVPIPAEYTTITKQVIGTPATTKRVVIPAQYKTVTKKVIATPGSTKRVPVPGVYDTVTTKKKVSEGKVVWRSILCDTNAAPEIIKNVQTALQRGGYYGGPIDGIIGSQTAAAVKRYQTQAKLPVDGLLTIDTVKSLGVNYK